MQAVFSLEFKNRTCIHLPAGSSCRVLLRRPNIIEIRPFVSLIVVLKQTTGLLNHLKLLLCYVMLCYVMLWYVMLCYVMLCYVMLCDAMLCINLLRCALFFGNVVIKYLVVYYKNS